MAEPNTQNQTNAGDNGGNNAGNGGNGSAKTYTQEELDNIVSERTGRATKSALSSFFKQKGLSEDEANSAITEYLDNKKKNTPDVSQLQNDLAAANSARFSAVVDQRATLEAIKQGVSVSSVPYVLKMADFKGVADENGEINEEKMTAAIKKVLEDVPALKGEGEKNGSGSGFSKIGGDGKNQNQTDDDTLRSIFGLKK